jgi:oligopeptide transport system substrate-binding protein
MRRILAILAGLCLLGVMTAYHFSGSHDAGEAGEGPETVPRYGGTYSRELGNNPITLDPHRVSDVYGRAIVSQLFDGLVSFDANLKPMPALAEYWQASRHGTTWTFSLRRGVRFHHGREMTAEDVIGSIDRLRGGVQPTATAAIFRAVEHIRMVDPSTIQMTLNHAFAPGLVISALAQVAVVPRDEVARLGEEFARGPVGTGPFVLERWEPGDVIELRAHETYYRGRPYLDRVVYRLNVGSRFEERFAAFVRGELDEAIIPSDRLEEIQRGAPYAQFPRHRKPTLSLQYLGFNTRVAPFNDPRVRQACAHAIDRHALVREVTYKRGQHAKGIFPPGMPGYDARASGPAYDPQKARALLAEAGYPHGEGLPVIALWSSNTSGTNQAELAAYQRDLGHVGVRVEIHFADDWPAYKAMLRKGTAPMFALAWYADLPDPDNMLAPLFQSDGPSNYTGYHNPRVDQALDAARHILDERQRLATYREIEQRILADAPIIPLYHHVHWYLYQPDVRGIQTNLLGQRYMPMRHIWFVGGPQHAHAR